MTTLNTCMPSTRAPKFINETLLQLKFNIDAKTVAVSDFTIPVSTIEKLSTQNKHRNSWVKEPHQSKGSKRQL